MGTWAGIALLITIIAAKMGAGHYQRARLTRAWETGMQAFQAGDLESAQTAFGRCVKWAPIWVVGRRMLGRTLASLDRHDDAEEQFTFAVQLEPGNGESYIDYAAYLAARGPERLDDAIDMLAKGLELAPDYADEIRRAPSLQVLRDNERIQSLLNAN
jgi:Tfp pilus assembly protein PilF